MAAADFNSDQITTLATAGAQLSPGLFGSNLRLYGGRFTMASTAKSKSIAMFTWKYGDIPWAIGLLTDATLATSQVSIGISGSTAKYKAAATYTTPNVWTYFMTEANIAMLSADEEVWITNDATADLPSSGEIVLVGVATRH